MLGVKFPLFYLHKLPKLVFLFLLILYYSFLSAQEPIKIFIYAGQSNSQGRSTALNNIPIGENNGDILFAWNIQSASNYLQVGWDTLKPVLRTNSQTTAIHAGELALGQNLYEAGIENIGIIKVAKSGTNLKVPWNPTFPRTSSLSGTGNGGMYWLMINFVEAKLADLDAQGIPYELAAICWHQGEADTRSSLAPDYERHFQQFVDSVKAHLDPEIEVYAVSVYNPSRDPNDVAIVRAAQESVASRSDHVHFIDLDSIYFEAEGQRSREYITSDGVHYTTPGYFKVGNAFANAYLAQNPLFPCDTLFTSDSLSSISIQTFPVSDCHAKDGSIVLSGELDSLIFSIDGGLRFQDTAKFDQLAAGEYFIYAQDNNSLGCKIPFPTNPLVLASPDLPEIQGITPISPSQCESSDGGFVVLGIGDSLEYSLDNLSFQSSGEFNGLASGNYRVFVREKEFPNCFDSLNVQVPKPSFCGPPECVNSTNIALDGVATQSTTRGNGQASFAIDGNLTGDDNWGDDANLQHTETEVGAWWKLDLGKVYTLDTLVIYNRSSTSNFILKRLNDFYVLMSEEDIDGNRSVDDLLNDPFIEDTLFDGEAGLVESLALGHRQARYILIKLPGEGPLHMSEVEVYGCETNPIICELSIVEVSTTDIDTCNLAAGSIQIHSVGNAVVYSIDGGQTFQSDSVFSGLEAGEYEVFIKELNEPSCVQSYSENPIRIVSPLDSMSIHSVLAQSIRGCDSLDGRIEIVAVGEKLEYSIDGGLNFVSTPIFEALDSGSYNIVIRDSTQKSCQKEYKQNPIVIFAPSIPPIDSVLVQDISDCGQIDGRISISASGDSLEYSIDGGLSYYASPDFNLLDSGTYELVIREISYPTCVSVYRENPIQLTRPTYPALSEVLSAHISDCGLKDGRIEILASGNALEYSIDGGNSFQSSSVFTDLGEGNYAIRIREIDFPNCLASDSLSTLLMSPPDCENCFSGNLSRNPGVSASQSTTRGNGVADFAIDGNLLGDDNWGDDANMTHTETQANPWWMLDLGIEATLDSLVIYNRTTTSAFLLKRLRDFYVFVSSAEIDASRSLEDLNTDPAIFPLHFPGEAGQVEKLPLNQQNGRYILIKLTGSSPLHLAEVEAWGCGLEEFAPASNSFRRGISPSKSSKTEFLSITVSPDPFKHSFQVEIQGEIEEGTYLKILNSLGQVIYTAVAHPYQKIRLGPHIPSGYYGLLIENLSQIEYVKMVKSD